MLQEPMAVKGNNRIALFTRLYCPYNAYRMGRPLSSSHARLRWRDVAWKAGRTYSWTGDFCRLCWSAGVVCWYTGMLASTGYWLACVALKECGSACQQLMVTIVGARGQRAWATKVVNDDEDKRTEGARFDMKSGSPNDLIGSLALLSARYPSVPSLPIAGNSQARLNQAFKRN